MLHAALMVAFLLAPLGSAHAQLVRTDSRTPYLHNIPLYDADGNLINPKDSAAPPYSPAITCGKCHEVNTINHGWHFSATRADEPDGRPGEPWIFYDPPTRTQTPLSYRDWPGLHHPEAFGISQWEFTRRFGRHFPGAGPGLPPADTDAADLAALPGRWHITGALENDCMICHAASRSYDVGEWFRQIDNQNFKWAPTAAARLAAVKGDTKSIPADFDPLLFDPLLGGPPGVQFPMVEYDARLFDSSNRVVFDVVRQPPMERCYYCHTTQNVDPASPPLWAHDQDIHIRAGMNCADCHKHGLDHKLVRGYPGEAAATGQPSAATLSCAGCHTGGGDSEDPALLAGRLGAPVPEHKGLPPIHFKVLSCTACHSGPWPGDDAQRIQTAMAHGLGIASETRTPADPPEITEPIFFRNHDGVIEPRRAVWPTYWASLRDEVVTPVNVEILSRVVQPLLPVTREEFHKLPGGWKPLTAEDITKVLKALVPRVPQGTEPVYIGGGLLHKLEGEGDSAALATRPHDAAQPYTWALAHDVRGAGQSLGVRGCTDCHAADSPLLAGSFTAGPASPVETVSVSMLESQQYDPELARAWALSFTTRGLFKIFGFVCCGIILLVILRQAPAALASDGD